MKHKDLISQMTLKEKVALLSGKTFWETHDIVRLNVPKAFLSDGPHGIRKQAASADHLGLNQSISATCFPTAACSANSWNLPLLKEMGEILSLEAANQRVNVLLGPGINIKRNVLCGRNFEYFSEDPYLAGKLAASLIQGIQTTGISACVKHFAANSQELLRCTNDSKIDERALREIYLTNFEIAVKEGVPGSLMSSYNLVNGLYANENPHLALEILRDEWGYKGVIVTDWGGENDRIEGLKCSNELEMPMTDGDTNHQVYKAVMEGTIPESLIDENIDRLLDLVLRTDKALKEHDGPIDGVKHHEVARKVAEDSMVLLENDGTLPLAKGEKVALIGKFIEHPRYQGAGSSKVNPHHVDLILEQVKNHDLDVVGYAAGFNFKNKISKKLEKEAIELAQKADKIVYFMGLDDVTEAEGLDRENIKIPNNQVSLFEKLVALGKKVVVVISAGSVTEISVLKKANAVLHAYLGGEAASSAVLNILTGEVNPSGKLAESYPFVLEDSPSINYFHKKEYVAEYRESIYVGYRYYQKRGIKVLYPFGYGLSYTTFEYSGLKVNEKGVTLTVKNTGKVKGKEIVQLYVGKKESEIYRPVKELKGFVKIELEPGEAKEVNIPFDEYTFRYFNVKTNKFEVEEGKYQIYVGASSEDIRLEGEIAKKGTTKEVPYVKADIEKYYTGEVNELTKEEFVKLYGEDFSDKDLDFYRKKRIHPTIYTTVHNLRYARGWTGRFFAWGLRRAIGMMKAFGKKDVANTIIMGIYYQPIRSFSRMMGGMLSDDQLKGMLLMFDGHFFKGLSTIRKLGKEKKARRKEMAINLEEKEVAK